MFCHDDIVVLCDQLGERLADALQTSDVIGVAGTDKIAGPTWYGTGNLYGNICHEVNGESSATAYSLKRGQIGGLQALDGVFLATRRDVVDRLPFDAVTFDGFHFYDLDFTFRASQLGLDVAVRTDIVLAHFSGGRLNEVWAVAAERFVRKFNLPTPPLPDRVSGGTVLTRDLVTAGAVIGLLADWLA